MWSKDWPDYFGSLASTVCAVHCAICGFLPALFGILGLGFPVWKSDRAHGPPVWKSDRAHGPHEFTYGTFSTLQISPGLWRVTPEGRSSFLSAGEVSVRGRSAFRDRYEDLFAGGGFGASVPGRLAEGPHCVDLEVWWRESEDGTRNEGRILVRYTLKDGHIGEVQFLD